MKISERIAQLRSYKVPITTGTFERKEGSFNVDHIVTSFDDRNGLERIAGVKLGKKNPARGRWAYLSAWLESEIGKPAMTEILERGDGKISVQRRVILDIDKGMVYTFVLPSTKYRQMMHE